MELSTWGGRRQNGKSPDFRRVLASGDDGVGVGVLGDAREEDVVVLHHVTTRESRGVRRCSPRVLEADADLQMPLTQITLPDLLVVLVAVVCFLACSARRYHQIDGLSIYHKNGVHAKEIQRENGYVSKARTQAKRLLNTSNYTRQMFT